MRPSCFFLYSFWQCTNLRRTSQCILRTALVVCPSVSTRSFAELKMGIMGITATRVHALLVTTAVAYLRKYMMASLYMGARRHGQEGALPPALKML